VTDELVQSPCKSRGLSAALACAAATHAAVQQMKRLRFLMMILPNCGRVLSSLAEDATLRRVNETLERIELKIAYLERANNELSDVVYRQQQELDSLRERVQRLQSQLDAAKQPDQPYTLEEERPPHY
jgi:SlyX protein